MVSKVDVKLVLQNKWVSVVTQVVAFAFVAGGLLISYLNNDSSSGAPRVPILDLPQEMTNIILFIGWATLGSVLLGVLAVKIGPKVYLWYIKFRNQGSEVRRIDLEDQRQFLPTVVKRMFLLFLFTTSIVSSLADSSFVELSWFLTPETYQSFLNDGIVVKYNFNVILNLFLIVLPPLFAACMVGWALEDEGLLQLELNTPDSKNYFSITPVFSVFMDFIKGYASISSLIFYFSAINYAITNNREFSDIGGLVIIFAFASAVLPAYLVYSHGNLRSVGLSVPKMSQIPQTIMNDNNSKLNQSN